MEQTIRPGQSSAARGERPLQRLQQARESAAIPPVPLDADFLDRAHRFLRLWRATGYQMWELDLLMQSGAVVNGVFAQGGLSPSARSGCCRTRPHFRLTPNSRGFSRWTRCRIAARTPRRRHRSTRASTSIRRSSHCIRMPTSPPSCPALRSRGNLSHHLDAIQASLGIVRGGRERARRYIRTGCSEHAHVGQSDGALSFDAVCQCRKGFHQRSV